MRQSRNVGALHETHREVDEEQARNTELSREVERDGFRTARHYEALRESQYRVDDRDIEKTRQDMPGPQRSWTHHGGMAPQQGSAMDWIRQNDEYGLSGWENSKPSRKGQEQEMSSPRSDQAQENQELAEARAAVEEARRQEAAERAQQQQRDRGGPER